MTFSDDLIPSIEYAQVFQGMPVPILLVGKSNLKLIAANTAALKRLNLDFSQFKGLPLEETLPLQSLQFTHLGSQVIQLPRKDGKAEALRVHSQILPEYILLSILPLDIPIQSQDLQRENVNLKTISQRKSELIANISHELRTPLTSILGWPEIILDSGSHDIALQAAQAIQKDGAILLSLLEDLIDLSKIEAGQMKVDRRPENLNEVIHNAVDVLKSQIFEKSIRLKLSLPKQHILADIDPLRIIQVVLNFLSNAIKYTSESGLIEIKMEVLNEEVQVSITDTGVGVKAEQQQKIFERFIQGDNAATGAGIGLSLVKSLIEMHDGHTWVESTPGQGATFFFTVPFVSYIEALPTPPIVETHARLFAMSQALPILLVDPSPTQEQVMQSMLRDSPLQIDLSSWKTFAEEVRRKPYQCILIESSSQNLEQSLQCLTYLHSQADLCQTPVMALTTSAMVEDREKYLHLGYDAYLSKPFTKKALLKCIHQILQRD